MTAKSNNAETISLQWLLTSGSPTRPTAWYAAVGTGSSETGLTGEPSGNGYARQAVTFSVSGDTASNTGALTFGPCSGSDWGTMSHIGIFDALTSGNLIYHGALASSRAIAVGDSLVFAIGDIDITEA